MSVTAVGVVDCPLTNQKAKLAPQAKKLAKPRDLGPALSKCTSAVQAAVFNLELGG
jgi:hypothetical protein